MVYLIVKISYFGLFPPKCPLFVATSGNIGGMVLQILSKWSNISNFDVAESATTAKNSNNSLPMIILSSFKGCFLRRWHQF